MNDNVDLQALRKRLAGHGGRHYWRSLEELADTDEFQEFVHREFPASAGQWIGETSRRNFLKVMGASLALAGLNGCTRQPEEKIVPFVRQPEQIVPGKPLQFATAMTFGGYATGLLVESHMGRPTKVEGNPDHPASLGASDTFAQAAVLTLYDPHRSQTVKNVDQISTWDAFLTAAKPRVDAARANAGRGLRILTETVTSPTLASQIGELIEAMPEAKWHQYEPLNRDNARAGAILAFGKDVGTVYDFTQADTILSLDADFLASGPGHLRYARDFSSRRKVVETPGKSPPMNRLYAVESTPTLTGAKADHRLALRARSIEALARAVAARLGIATELPASDGNGLPDAWIEAVVDDLKNYRSDGGASLVLAGPWQPPVVHALAHAMNRQLGNVGKSVVYTEPVEARPIDQLDSLGQLVDDMRAGRVEMLVIAGGNPIFNAPSDFDFATALDGVPWRVHLGLYENETSALCHWHIPETHFLEAWTDARAFNGTVSIVQPLIAPLYDGRSIHELLALLLGRPGAKPYDLVRQFWQGQRESGSAAESPPAELDFDDWWQTVLHDGLMRDTQFEPVEAEVRSDIAAEIDAVGYAFRGGEFDIVFRPDPSIWDGRFADNGWLQELPKPLTKLTWGNAALISPQTATAENLTNGDVVELEDVGRKLRLPVWIAPGHPDNSATIHFGNGRTICGPVGKNVGFNAFAIRPSTAPWFATGARLRRAGATYPLATTQHHFAMEDRHLVRGGTLSEYREHPEHPPFMETGHAHGPPVSMFPERPYDGYKWGMSIDLTSCIGCNACVIACQAENNIPVVGKEEVMRGREMHWIRVDQYYEGGLDDPATHFQPLPCMHCENAPCEVVCPVAATTHSDEGINEMTYNRCVGTRYCANNCPYKVRRFNFFDYTESLAEHDTLKMLQNPDVTVRARGVMEKCTYCVQRVNRARITAENEDRQIKDGEVVTACQQACPTEAIVFGNLNDANSRIAKVKEEMRPLDYSLLEEQNTRPRTTYLAWLRNPNPTLENSK